MNIAVLGMWHLGTVTAACLASAGYRVLGFDGNRETVNTLNLGRLPVAEPGLEELIQKGLDDGLLRFSSAPEEISNAEVVWVAYDTPVDEEDRADIDHVVDNTSSLFPYFRDDVLVIVSSQLPIGSTRRMEELFARTRPDHSVSFACVPENLRLGKALSVFLTPDRIVAGVRSKNDRGTIGRLLSPFTNNIVWMSVESAEMTKHGINAFLAASVAFANELAVICERCGADAREVERGLKSDMRIGPQAYLKPGSPFAGGTLARDLNFLVSLGESEGTGAPLIAGVLQSNARHKLWSRRKLQEILGELQGKRVAVLGLTYKPGTDTLRRSESVETCRWLSEQGAIVSAYDPALRSLPASEAQFITLCSSVGDALLNAHAILVATEWPQFREVKVDDILRHACGPDPVVLDPGSFLAFALEGDARIRYATVGKPI